jgi:pimeloyl-ACP methyl ester carboxylesterase
MSLCNVIAKAKQPNYGRINVPLLILSGADDKTTPLSGSEAILNAYGTAEESKRIEILAGVGHWYCVEAPEEVGSHVLSFIKNVWL